MKKNNGFTGVDIAISVVIFTIFVTVIASMFYNLTVTETRIQRKTEATNLAIKVIETMKIIEFDKLTEGMSIDDINNLITDKIEVPNGYSVTVGVDNSTYPDVIKIISVQVNYKLGKQDETINIETLVKNGAIIIEPEEPEEPEEPGESGEPEEPGVTREIQIGDYVKYNPVVSDMSGTAINGSKLTYTSLKGTGQSHGNGASNYKFTANSNIKWQVLSIGTDTIKLISKDSIKTDLGENFTLKGVIGYLYAEQELNEICKIYGYGYGADTSQVTEYNYGGPLDGDLTGRVTGSGARSITIEDINEHAQINTVDDIKKIDSYYGNTSNPTVNIYYPTIKTSTGKSNSEGVKNLKNTYYSYTKDRIENPIVQTMLSNESYWLASRCLNTGSDYSYFIVYGMENSYMNAYRLSGGDPYGIDEYANDLYAVRPIVTLKLNVIDKGAGYNEANGGWQLK